MIFSLVLREYSRNLKACLAFAVLVAFFPFFLAISTGSQAFLSSGSVFLSYGQAGYPLLSFLALLVIALIQVLAFSFFLAVLVMAVKMRLSKQEPKFLYEGVKKNTFRIFSFYFLEILFFFLAGQAFLLSGLPMWLFLIIVLAVSLAFFYMPQAIVVDDLQLDNAMAESIDFMGKKRKEFASSFVLAVLLVAVPLVVEFIIESIVPSFPLGSILSLFLVLAFSVPLIEIMKTYYFMSKFRLVWKTLD